MQLDVIQYGRYQIFCRGLLNWVWGRGERRETILLSWTRGGQLHHARHTLAAECTLSLSYTHSEEMHQYLSSLLSVGLSLWHAVNPWDRQGSDSNGCKKPLLCVSETVAWTLWANPSTTHLPTTTLYQRFENPIKPVCTGWEKQILSNCNAIR